MEAMVQSHIINYFPLICTGRFCYTSKSKVPSYGYSIVTFRNANRFTRVKPPPHTLKLRHFYACDFCPHFGSQTPPT